MHRILSCWAAPVARPYLSTGCFYLTLLNFAANLCDLTADLSFVLTDVIPPQCNWSLVFLRIWIKSEQKRIPCRRTCIMSLVSRKKQDHYSEIKAFSSTLASSATEQLLSLQSKTKEIEQKRTKKMMGGLVFSPPLFCLSVHIDKRLDFLSFLCISFTKTSVMGPKCRCGFRQGLRPSTASHATMQSLLWGWECSAYGA